MNCPHDNISLPTTSDPDTVCADCGAILNPDQIPKSIIDTTGSKVQPERQCKVQSCESASYGQTAAKSARWTIHSTRGCAAWTMAGFTELTDDWPAHFQSKGL